MLKQKHKKRAAGNFRYLSVFIAISFLPQVSTAETVPVQGEHLKNIERAQNALQSSKFDEVASSAEELLKVPRENFTREQLSLIAELCGILAENEKSKLSEQERTNFRDAGTEIVESIWERRGQEKPKESLGGFGQARLQAIAPYVINTGNNGQFSSDGKFSSSAIKLDQIFDNAESLQTKWLSDKKTNVRNIVIYSHGGLVSEGRGLRTAETMLPGWLAKNIYPINIVWQSGAAETIGYIKADRKMQTAGAESVAANPPDNASGLIGFSLRKTAVILPSTMVEKAARKKIAPVWSEMKCNALGISGIARRLSAKTSPTDGNNSSNLFCTVNTESPGSVLSTSLKQYSDKHPGEVKIHLVGHSAGSIVLSGLLHRLCDAGLTVETMTFLAPAITVADYKELVEPILKNGKVKKVMLFDLSDKLEQKDVSAFKGFAYKSSLLYLVSRALETLPDGEKETPLLGMTRFVLSGLPDNSQSIHQAGNTTASFEVIVSDGAGNEKRSAAKHHGDFDNDQTTINSVVETILSTGK